MYRFGSKLVLSRPVAFALAATGVAISASFALATPHVGSTLTGAASVIDGDTLDVGGVRVRLEGIDAPELAQTCGRGSAATKWLGNWRCGEAAARELSKLVSGGSVSCQVEGHDKYGRVLGLCSANDRDINATLVKTGYAWAFVKYSTRFAKEETQARAQKVGVWSGPSEAPWEFRAHKWEMAAGTEAPNGCAIKGNVSANGRIYHMPWSPWYGKVKVETDKGERWFCSETEASAAGFRAAYAP